MFEFVTLGVSWVLKEEQYLHHSSHVNEVVELIKITQNWHEIINKHIGIEPFIYNSLCPSIPIYISYKRVLNNDQITFAIQTINYKVRPTNLIKSYVHQLIQLEIDILISWMNTMVTPFLLKLLAIIYLLHYNYINTLSCRLSYWNWQSRISAFHYVFESWSKSVMDIVPKFTSIIFYSVIK